MTSISDEIIILGSAGGRFHAATQLRSTGGIIIKLFNGKYQCHLDPGPGAIRDLRDYKINSRLTTHVFLTHAHTDHSMSIPIIIEALQKDFAYHEPRGCLIAPTEYLESGELNSYYKNLLQTIISVNCSNEYLITEDFSIKTIPTNHGKLQNVGFIFSLKYPQCEFKIAFTSDTANFPGYTSLYKGVDVLVANVLRPDNSFCRGHLCVDEFIPLLKEISPKLCILIHFGAQMINPISGDRVDDQIKKIKKAVGPAIQVIGGKDGLHVPFLEYFEI
ncbi:MBL fold metallo-hydrolase [Candidatus Lokiarchaeum ossiferum]|uniref:MBL fold metallo-hydrolase n=1 Tax=Candidatus Lokiarchaeum ossiferum TaxID=2951803 RepID=UPI00352E4A8A